MRIGGQGCGGSDGVRVGRYVILHDGEGTRHALSATTVQALCEADEATLLLLSGGHLVRTEHLPRTILAWIEPGARP
ncbi:hypothetical protein ACE7GA_12970 [Roseomonas sp. CCTCC AB2023176]|uniref:hypothetical protein n=1 Tax=Roseomonas sp. CCTCC AB2023176 TaxID=3342640 RepID=UPI0035DD70E6